MSVVTARPDFAVLGGGLVGRLIAWRLAGDGHRVALYERGGPDGEQSAAWVAAAMLAPLAEAASAELLITELGAASLARWPQWLAELPEPVFFQQHGTLVVWHHADRAEAPLFERRVRANAPAGLLDGGFVSLAGAQVDVAEPALAGRFARGLLLPREGQLDNRQALRALAAGLAERGVDTHWHVAIDANSLPDAHFTIDCRGLGAKPVLPVLRGIRGEVARLHAPGIGLTRPVRLLHPRYPLYIAPKQDDLYVIGATEVEGEDMSPVSVRSALELLSAAFSVHPAFGEARILELNAQCRPTLPDHRPALIWDGAATLAVNGLYRHGFMIAPEVAHAAAALAQAALSGTLGGADAFAAWRGAARWPDLLHHRDDARQPA
ncbi:cytochrome C biogenesis protein CcdA [Burkholderia stagnalis]|uniref:FAD-dependent oxidoreductase n=1 Tax=Burkholderia stagnalis TaxID=1503054 RepID=A0A6L3N003_9BURK|nr:FAD-dependent oxidoreductase [Burkholderia stagnalis]KAB0637991.1 FAD-dependent oxidoreductase [Burkholderia stagnalis]KVO42416.1 cytochrome C biogenesis protein CcdA [Burkholderia stagnalis]KVO76052.1 cytochrome C biogenesis protein CcdA [Burkholderia stagnalis]KVW59472.1 cytochrome C biogenesis protein CcdA [Burkholderia stagnalis]KVW87658.1 cytochrome C biogenesis protein CcdA [Burkholderia stagnalis]